MKTFPLSCLMALTLTIISSDAVADDFTIDDVRRELETWRNSFVNVRVEWTLLQYRDGPAKPLPDWPAPDIDAGVDPGTWKWIWADDGMLLEEHAGHVEYEGIVPYDSRTIDAYNGREGVAFRATFNTKAGDVERLRLLTIRGSGKGKPSSVFCPPMLMGLYWNGSVRWLPEVLSDWDWISEGFEEVRGHRCLRLVTAPQNPDLPWIEAIVDEFQQLPGGQWFPKRGRLQLQPEPINQLWVVTDVVFNEQLDIRQFRPPPPEEGTIVDDHFRSYVHGRRSSPAGDVSGSEADSSERRTGTAATVPVPLWRWWSAGLASVSLFLLALGVWLRRRRNLENE